MKSKFTGRRSVSLIRILFVYTLLLSLFAGGVRSQDEFELVQSAPSETIYESSELPKTFDVWKKMIDESKVTIDIEAFYFADAKGEPLENIIESIKNSSQRGVKVRIIVDSSFYARNDKSVDLLEGIENISIRKIPYGNLAGGVMHAKYFIVDNENLFLGSQNMDWRAIKHIHEIGVRVKNKSLANTFKELFETDWKLCEGNIYGLVNQKPVNVVNSENPVKLISGKYGEMTLYPSFSPPVLNVTGFSSEEDELLKIIENTKERLLIQIYSFSDKDRYDTVQFSKISDALIKAAGRNVSIKMILPDWAMRDYSEDFLKELSKFNNIEIKISTIPQYSGGFIPFARVDHSKYLISDNDISWVSTSNWESGYFRRSRNVTMIINNNMVNEDLVKVFETGWTSPYVNFIDINKKYESVKRN
ncbi:MAG: hypothetical protein IPM38_17900 [Ignavibacteria bacterium]|nr:hypothetical protein [Ignavibacteria bacterium]